jgi:hypothetical protein
VRPEKRHNILSEFDFRLLDDPEFQEDSVREEIIVPILKRLGYRSAKPYRIIRSKKLLHPFVSIGSATKRIYLVPDYLLEVDGRFAWALEAKAPTEKILNTKHVEQAYSYAIHSEIRVPYFALCNGREFVLYHISRPCPIVHFDMQMLPSVWDNLIKLLGPNNVLDYDFTLSKDFGLHLKRLGFYEFDSLIFPDVPIEFIGKLADDQYTFSSGLKYNDGESYVVSFDFNSEVMEQLYGKIPNEAFQILREPLADRAKQLIFTDAIYRVTVDCRVGDKLAENEDEIFLPLWINRILE